MNRNGIRLVQLKLTGPGVADATMDFTDGLNVICGPSDTGKTFAFQCINYMLGGSSVPKAIPEAQGYDTAWLTIGARSGDSRRVLQRSLKGGDFLCTDEGQVTVPLKADHDAKAIDNISQVLLSMSDLSGRIIRKSAKETRSLTFRDVSRLILVDEEAVIRERSPIHTGQFIKKTGETAVFRLLLEGTDDSSVITALADKRLATHKKATSEVISALVEKTHARIRALNAPDDRTTLIDQIAETEDEQRTASAALESASIAMTGLEETRRDHWRIVRELQSRMDVKEQISVRLGLLERQYESDIARLESMSEAHGRLAQMPDNSCVVCGAAPEHQDIAGALDESILLACRAESSRTSQLLADLRSTIAANLRQLLALRTEFAEAQSSYDAVNADLGQKLKPQAAQALREFHRLGAVRDSLREALALYDQLDQLAEMKTWKPAELRVKSNQNGDQLDSAAVEEFSMLVHRLLSEWHFPNLDRVTFNEKDMDLVISGRARGSHGKGVRALTHAAFTLALMAYCDDKHLPHPGLVVIDSPLVVYKEPDTDEHGFAPNVKDAFYRAVADGFYESQVVVMENQDPPSDIGNRANVIDFTGTREGRRGFIPVR